MAGVEVGIAADKAVAVVAVVGVVAGIKAIVAPQPLARRQVDFLIRIAAVHVVRYHIEDRLDPGTVQRVGGLLELAVAAIAAVLVEVVPEVALAAARGAVAGVAPAGEVTPGYRHPDGAEAVRGDAWSHAGKGAVPVVGGGAHDVPVKALQDDFVAAVVAHAIGRFARGFSRLEQAAVGVRQGRQCQDQPGKSQVSFHRRAPFCCCREHPTTGDVLRGRTPGSTQPRQLGAARAAATPPPGTFLRRSWQA